MSTSPTTLPASSHTGRSSTRFLSKMRNTHTTLCQEAGMLDSMNQSMHRNTGAVQQRHYLKPDTTEAAIQVSRKIR